MLKHAQCCSCQSISFTAKRRNLIPIQIKSSIALDGHPPYRQSAPTPRPTAPWGLIWLPRVRTYNSTKDQNAALTSETQTLQSENAALQEQVENLKSVLLNTYSMDEIDTVVAQGYLDEVETKRLDNLELLDSERCEQVASVRDLYGTTHSVSYKFDPWQEAWAKFKLDGRYDTFEANILTSDDTSRDANISVEIYVDDVLVGRVDNIVRDENVRPISVSVNGGKVLMIKAINTDSASGSICYVSDTNLTVLQ